MSGYFEPPQELSPEVRNISMAINSLKEELEAVDYYNQRVSTTTDEALKQIMAHNRDEEIEHACMTIEWLRRNMGKWDEELRTYIFQEGDITDLEGEPSETSSFKNDLGLGDLS